MKSIFKYELPIRVETKDHIILKIYKGSTPLCIQKQLGTPCLWMQVDTDQPLDNMLVKAYETGREMPESIMYMTYIGTLQFDDGRYILHYYYRTNYDIQTHTTTS